MPDIAQELSSRLRRAALLPRVLTAVIGIPLLLGLLWLGGPWWRVVTAFVVAMAVREFAPLRGLSRRTELVLGITALLAFLIMATAPGGMVWAVFVWALLMVGLGLLPLLRSGGTAPPASSVVLGVAYLATPLGMLARWRLEQTAWSVLAFLVIIWVNDIAAYFVGIAVGRHKLAPRTSPGKSWEGAAAGLAAGAVAGILAAPWLGLAGGAAAAWAAIITVVSQAGDLFESALKRRAGVKDSGVLLPGHGGILDRFDGILVAAPAAYALLLEWRP